MTRRQRKGPTKPLALVALAEDVTTGLRVHLLLPQEACSWPAKGSGFPAKRAKVRAIPVLILAYGHLVLSGSLPRAALEGSLEGPQILKTHRQNY